MNKDENIGNEIKIKIGNWEPLKLNETGIITIFSEERKINIETLMVPEVFHNIIPVKKLTEQ